MEIFDHYAIDHAERVLTLRRCIGRVSDKECADQMLPLSQLSTLGDIIRSSPSGHDSTETKVYRRENRDTRIEMRELRQD